MRHPSPNRALLEKMTWSDIESWAGGKIVNRGKSLHYSGAVKSLALAESGELIAEVQGTHLYVTKVSMNEGNLASVCTCPFGVSCKHAVAALLAYLQRIKKKEEVETAAPDDYRLVAIENNEDYDADQDKENEDDFYRETPQLQRGASQKQPLKIPDLLQNKSKKQLLEILGKAIKNNPELLSELQHQEEVKKTPGPALVKKVRRELAYACSEPGWWNPWKNEGHIPDFSRVVQGLAALRKKGHADEAVELGKAIWKEGNAIIEQSNDEGETASGIACAMDEVFQSLGKCDLPNIDKMEMAATYELTDEYGLCEGLQEFWKRKFSIKEWSGLADRLLARLEKAAQAPKDKNWGLFYRRSRILNIIIRALENAERYDEMLALCKNEAEKAGDYDRLVDLLASRKEYDKAEEWIKKGLAHEKDNTYGHGGHLWDKLLEIRKIKKDWPYIAALHAQSFFCFPNLDGYLKLKTAGDKFGAWDTMRPFVMRFLETGKKPGANDTDWNLPVTGIRSAEPSNSKPPFSDVLLNIAITEKEPAQVLKWYEVWHGDEKKYYQYDMHNQAAEAMSSAYPDKAVELWKKLGESLVVDANVGNYTNAAKYFRKARRVMVGLGRTTEWDAYLETIKAANKRKIRLIEILSHLSEKPIVEE